MLGSDHNTADHRLLYSCRMYRDLAVFPACGNTLSPWSASSCWGSLSEEVQPICWFPETKRFFRSWWSLIHYTILSFYMIYTMLCLFKLSSQTRRSTRIIQQYLPNISHYYAWRSALRTQVNAQVQWATLILYHFQLQRWFSPKVHNVWSHHLNRRKKTMWAMIWQNKVTFTYFVWCMSFVDRWCDMKP